GAGRARLGVGARQANGQGEAWRHVVGFLAAPLRVRVNAGGEVTFRKLLGRVRTAVLEVQEHQELPVELLLEERRGPQAVGGELFNVVFTLLNVPMPTVELPGLTIRPETIDPGVAGYCLGPAVAGRRGVVGG